MDSRFVKLKKPGLNTTLNTYLFFGKVLGW